MPKVSQSDRPRACASCAQAKTRCAWPDASANGDQICQRCSKYSLTCSVTPPRPVRKRGKSTQAKNIEQKLDNILSLLGRADDTSVSSGPAIGRRQRQSQYSLMPSSTAAWPDPVSLPPHLDVVDISPGYRLSLDEADRALEQYKNDLVPQFPFVPLPRSNARDLYRDKPLLLKTILSVSRPPDPDCSTAFQKWFRQSIAYETVVLMKKNIETLQALLVYLAWTDISSFAGGQETSLAQLALGIVGDMKLCEPPDSPRIASGSIVVDAARLRNDVPHRAQHTSDDRRAVLGIFYITSVLSSLLGKSLRLDYAPYLDECCRILLLSQETPTDSLLVNLVHVQKIAAKVHETFRGASDMMAVGNPLANIHAMAMATIRKELDTHMRHLPSALQGNTLLRSHHAAVRIRLFESVMHGHQSSDTRELPGFRSQALWNCLASTQALMDQYSSIPAATCSTLTFVSMLHLALAIIKAAQLSCMDDREWDAETDRANLNLGDHLDRLSERFESADQLNQPRSTILLEGRPLLAEHARNFRSIREWYLANSGLGDDACFPPASAEPLFAQYAEQYDSFEFWQQLADMTTGGIVP